MPADDFINPDNSSNTSSNSGGGGGSGGGGRGVPKIDFSRNYFMVVQYPDGRIEGSLKNSRILPPGDTGDRSNTYEVLAALGTRLAWENFRSKCIDQEDIDPHFLLEGNDGKWGDVDLPSDAAQEDRLLELVDLVTDIKGTGADTNTSQCAVCGKSHKVRNLPYEKDAASTSFERVEVVTDSRSWNGTTKVPTCTDHSVSELMKAADKLSNK